MKEFLEDAIVVRSNISLFQIILSILRERISFNGRSPNRIIQAFSLVLLFTSSSILLSDDLENFLDQRKYSAYENYQNTCLKVQAWDACDETEFPAILKLLDEGKETRGPAPFCLFACSLFKSHSWRRNPGVKNVYGLKK